MKSIKIEVPEGYEIDEKNSTFSEIKFKPIKKEVKSWEDLNEIKGYLITNDSRIVTTSALFVREWNRNTWATKEEAEACLALSQLSQLKKHYNGDWSPDKIESHHTRYCISTSYGGLVKGDWVGGKAFLTFETEKIRDAFWENHKELLEQAKMFL